MEANDKKNKISSTPIILFYVFIFLLFIYFINESYQPNKRMYNIGVVEWLTTDNITLEKNYKRKQDSLNPRKPVPLNVFNVAVIFNNGQLDTLSIAVRNIDDIGLSNGNLYYDQYIDGGRRRITKASFVRSYDVYQDQNFVFNHKH